MIRSILFIKTAIGLVQPTMDDGLKTSYATILQQEAKQRGFDPLTVVAMVENESHWNSRLVGGLNNQCVGLGQHCLHIYDYCRETDYRGARCQEKKAWLLNGANNLRATSSAITKWRAYCRKRTGRSALFHRWLYGYQGHGYRDKTKECGMKRTKRGWVDLPKPALVKKVMRRRVELIRATERKLRRR
jgi:hypothetical protein